MDLSVGKLVAGAMGATAAAVVTSAFSVQGTLIGAAVMSIVWTVSTAVLDHSVTTAQQRMRQSVERSRARRSGEEVPPPTLGWQRRLGLERLRNVRWGEIRWRRVAAASAVVFAVAAGGILAFEALTGRPVAARVGGAPSGSSGSSVGWLVGEEDPGSSEPASTPGPDTTAPTDPGDTPAPGSEPESEPDPGSDPDEPGTEPDQEFDQETDPEPGTDPGTDPGTEPETEPGSLPEPATDEPGTGTAPGTDPESQPAPGDTPGPAGDGEDELSPGPPAQR